MVGICQQPGKDQLFTGERFYFPATLPFPCGNIPHQISLINQQMGVLKEIHFLP